MRALQPKKLNPSYKNEYTDIMNEPGLSDVRIDSQSQRPQYDFGGLAGSTKLLSVGYQDTSIGLPTDNDFSVPKFAK